MEIDDIISNLKQLNLSTEPYDEVKKLLIEAGNVLYPLIVFHQGKTLTRARPNEKGERFKNKSDFSFKPQNLNTTYQRASTPYQTMFYAGVLPDEIQEGGLNIERIIGLLESMPWVNDKETSGYGKISYGRWVVKEDIKLISIIFNNSYNDKNNFIQDSRDNYNQIAQNIDERIIEHSVKFQKFLADEFSKKIEINTDYMISAIFSELVCNRSDFDGIYYPSTKTGGEGFNVALKPSACEKIELRVAGECSIYKRKDVCFLGNDYIVQLDGKTDSFEMEKLDDDSTDILKKIGVKSIEELKNL